MHSRVPSLLQSLPALGLVLNPDLGYSCDSHQEHLEDRSGGNGSLSSKKLQPWEG